MRLMREGFGELLMLGFHGTELPAWLLDFEARHGLGGVILFDRDLERKSNLRNIESPSQLRTLCEQIHALDSQPLVFIDQEGGLVRRLKPDRGFKELPSAEALARLDEAVARAQIAESFKEMAALGIDFDLAPVVDLNSNPDNPNIGALERSLSDDPRDVRRCVALYAEEAERVGLRLCLKHYPGLGGATTDSHTAVTDISGTVSEDQLRLFRELVDVIPGRAILVSHGIVSEWDPKNPVSLSAPAISRLRSAGPDALLISDDVQMQGFQAFAATAPGAVRAIEAGLDLICIGNNLRSEADECDAVVERLAARSRESDAFSARCRAAHDRVRQRKHSTC